MDRSSALLLKIRLQFVTAPGVQQKPASHPDHISDAALALEDVRQLEVEVCDIAALRTLIDQVRSSLERAGNSSDHR